MIKKKKSPKEQHFGSKVARAFLKSNWIEQWDHELHTNDENTVYILPTHAKQYREPILKSASPRYFIAIAMMGQTQAIDDILYTIWKDFKNQTHIMRDTRNLRSYWTLKVK